MAAEESVCARFGAVPEPVDEGAVLGLGRNFSSTAYPVNGLRHPAEGGTSGWYLWSGEGDPGEEDDFFQPVHTAHLLASAPELRAYLELPSGWRFLLAPGYEDVWYEPELLDTGL